MQTNRLQLNTNKTELLWCTTTRRQCQLPRSALRIGTDVIIPSAVVRDLRIYIDSDLSMQSHVQQTVSGCFAVLRQLRSIWRSVPSSVFQTLVVAFVLTRLDYGNATLAGLPAILLDRLQSVLSASVQSIAVLCHSAHITDTVASFHWLRVHEQIEFKRFLFTELSMAPRPDICVICWDALLTYHLAVIFVRRLPVSSSSVRRTLSLSGIVRSLQLARDSGTVFQTTLRLPLLEFRRKLKTHLFWQSYPDVIL